MLNSRNVRPTALAMAIALGVTGCASVDHQLGGMDKTSACVAGGMLGAVLGAGVAVALGKNAAGGAIAGAAVGCGATLAYQARVKRLQAIATEEGMSMQIKELATAQAPTQGKSAPQSQPVGIEAQVQDSAMFATGSAVLTANGERQLRKMAAVLAEGQSGTQTSPKKILVVGHTDSTGNAELNQRLSEQRARAVSAILAQAGLQPILKEDATVAVQPFMPFTPNYKTSKKQSEKIQSIANTFDGETKVLYRVFAVDASKSPVSCMDIVFDKRTGTATAGELFYPKQGEAFVAEFEPVRR